jgi:hypothetical protein
MRLSTVARIAALTLAPILLAVLVLYTRSSPDGAGVTNDPDSYYILNGLLFATRGHIHYMDHPGVPVSLIAGILIWLKGFFSTNPILDDVLLRPDFYHAYLGNITLGINCGAIFAFGIYLLRRNVALWFIIFAQFLFFISVFQIIWFSGRLLPEGLMLALGAVLGIVWLSQLNGKERPIFFGVILGTAISIKINFLPFLLLLLGYRAWKACIISFLSSLGVFYIYTLLLRADRQAIVFQYFSDMASHVGRYGGGERGIIRSQQLLENINSLWQEDRFALIVMSLVLLLTLMQFIQIIYTTPKRERVFPYALPVLVVLGNLVATLKHPAARYLLPSATFFPAVLSAFYLKVPRRHFVPSAILLLSFLFVYSEKYLATPSMLRSQKVELREWDRTITPILKENSSCLLLFAATAPTREWSSFSGNGGAGSSFNDDLLRIYPKVYFLNLTPLYFSSWRERITPVDFFEIVRHEKCIIYHSRDDLLPRNTTTFKNRGTVLATNQHYTLIKYGPTETKNLEFAPSIAASK